MLSAQIALHNILSKVTHHTLATASEPRLYTRGKFAAVSILYLQDI